MIAGASCTKEMNMLPGHGMDLTSAAKRGGHVAKLLSYNLDTFHNYTCSDNSRGTWTSNSNNYYAPFTITLSSGMTFNMQYITAALDDQGVQHFTGSWTSGAIHGSYTQTQNYADDAVFTPSFTLTQTK